MMDFSFAQANNLNWSNKRLDFVIAVRLLLLTYDVRPEAESFRHRRNELKAKCLAEIGNLRGLVKELRQAFPLGTHNPTTPHP